MSAASNNQGDFIWYELLTKDADAAQAFYGSILGWSFVDSGQPGMDYRIVNAGEISVAGLMGITPDMAAGGARTTWLSYVSVSDVDATVTDIEARGGSVVMPAMDIPNVGRIAMVADPQGAPFYIMKASGEGKSLAFAWDKPRPGHGAWNELRTGDQAAAWAFYGPLFGWSKEGEMDMGAMGKYEFLRGDGVVGAFMGLPPGVPQAHWNTYFRVVDIDVAKTKVEAGGGTVLFGPDQIPGGDYTIICIDPQGAGFGLVGGRV
jgi:predicted enzyme related to lactoylglutathione lyase